MKLNTQISVTAGHDKSGHRLIKDIAEVSAFGKCFHPAQGAYPKRPAQPGIYKGVGGKSRFAIGKQAMARYRNPHV